MVILVNTREVVDNIATGVVNVEAKVDVVNLGVNELLARVPAATTFVATSNVSHVLPCPAPSHFFVGRENGIADLSHLFFPVVAIQVKSEERSLLEALIKRLQISLEYVIHCARITYF